MKLESLKLLVLINVKILFKNNFFNIIVIFVFKLNIVNINFENGKL